MKIYILIFFALIDLSYSKFISINCCKFKDQDGNCLKCDPGYHTYKTGCYKDIGFCESYLQGVICNKCSEDYYLQNNVCYYSKQVIELTNNKLSEYRSSNQMVDKPETEDEPIAIDLNNSVVDRFVKYVKSKNGSIFERFQLLSLTSRGSHNSRRKFLATGIISTKLIKFEFTIDKNANIRIRHIHLINQKNNQPYNLNKFVSFEKEGKIQNLIRTLKSKETKYQKYSPEYVSLNVNYYKIIWYYNFKYYSTIVSLKEDTNQITTLNQANVDFSDIKNCATVAIDGSCQQCTIGYHQFQNQCYYNIGGCITYTRGNICTSCAKGYLLINNKCSSDCGLLCNTQIGEEKGIHYLHSGDSNNCAYQVEDHCLRCRSGYYLKQLNCTLDTRSDLQKQQLMNCRIQNGQGQCLKCNYGFYLYKGSCVSVSQNCVDFTDQGVCNSCYRGYYLSNDNTCLLYDPLCKTISLDGNCSSCYQGYSLAQGKCILRSQQCKSYNQLNLCISCYQGYHLINHECLITKNDLCKVWENQKCKQCSYRSYMNNGTCVEIDQQCATYNSQNGQCITCYSGYSIIVGKCVLI